MKDKNKFISELVLLCDKHNKDMAELKYYDELQQIVITFVEVKK